MTDFRIKDLLISVGRGWCGNTDYGPLCELSCINTELAGGRAADCTPGCTAGGDSCNGSGGPCRAGCSAIVTNAGALDAALRACTPGCTAGGDSCNGSGGPCAPGCSAIVTNVPPPKNRLGGIHDMHRDTLAELKVELRRALLQVAEREDELQRQALAAARPPATIAEVEAMERHLAEALDELRRTKAGLLAGEGGKRT